VALSSCAWLAVGGFNSTVVNGPGGTVDVHPVGVVLGGSGGGGGGGSAFTAGPVLITYLQGDWPVPFIYASPFIAPGLPAAPFTIAAPISMMD
jgi:hypothetical protein